jgi:SAM-dependent methyltransferase
LVEQSSGSVYYSTSGGVPLASRLSLHVRRKIFALFMEAMRPGPQTTVLDVGVTSDDRHRESNYFEQRYPYPHNITCVGTEDGSHLASRYPGLTYRQTREGDPLPFRDREFDVVYSNAVLEHVASRASQAEFVRELCRVGKAFFIATPDRMFPFEHHTGLPLLHYLPPPIFRRLIAKTRYDYWSLESNLNILTARELAGLFPAEATLNIHRIRLMGIPSNLVAIGSTMGARPGGLDRPAE